MLEVKIYPSDELPEEYKDDFQHLEDHNNLMVIERNGESIFATADNFEPEDTLFYRDLSFVPEQIEKAYRAGMEDGHKEELTCRVTTKAINDLSFPVSFIEVGSFPKFVNKLDPVVRTPPVAIIAMTCNHDKWSFMNLTADEKKAIGKAMEEENVAVGEWVWATLFKDEDEKQSDQGDEVKIKDIDVYEWIPVKDRPHPLNVEFVAFYGKGSKRREVVFLDGTDLAISHWYPLPETNCDDAYDGEETRL